VLRIKIIAGLSVLALSAAPAFAASTKHMMHSTKASAPHPDQSADMLNAQQLAQIRGGSSAPAPAMAPAKK
jgi:hypothetical protein